MFPLGMQQPSSQTSHTSQLVTRMPSQCGSISKSYLASPFISETFTPNMFVKWVKRGEEFDTAEASTPNLPKFAGGLGVF
jgi:hypothetical protein